MVGDGVKDEIDVISFVDIDIIKLRWIKLEYNRN